MARSLQEGSNEEFDDLEEIKIEKESYFSFVCSYTRGCCIEIFHNTNHKSPSYYAQDTDFLLSPFLPLLEGAQNDFLGESFSGMKRRMCIYVKKTVKQTHHGTVQW